MPRLSRSKPVEFGRTDVRLGNLPQLDTFDFLACVPTSVANALLALGVDELMQEPSDPGSYDSLNKTRNILAEHYFYTSAKWSSVVVEQDSSKSLQKKPVAACIFLGQKLISG
jgi:hypothetical protein